MIQFFFWDLHWRGTKTDNMPPTKDERNKEMISLPGILLYILTEHILKFLIAF